MFILTVILKYVHIFLRVVTLLELLSIYVSLSTQLMLFKSTSNFVKLIK